jgi:hypothetical protein
MKALDSSGEFSFRMLWKGYTSEIEHTTGFMFDLEDLIP